MALEGDYSTWALQWKRGYSGDTAASPRPNFIYVSENLNKIIIPDAWDGTIQILQLSNGTLQEESAILQDDYHSQVVPSIIKKYFGVVKSEGGVPVLKIYKAGVVIATLDLNTLCNWSNLTRFYNVVFSSDGKYIFISNTATSEYALFKGS